jgi:hypothetical protein
MSMLYVQPAWQCWFSMLHVSGTCPCNIHASCPCCMSALHAHVNAAVLAMFPCCTSALHVHVHAASHVLSYSLLLAAPS